MLASEAIVILCLALAKCSVLLLVRRIGPTTSKFCDPLLGISVLWGLASILTITISCSASHVVGVNGFCENQASYLYLHEFFWVFLTIYAAAPLGAYRCLRLDNRDRYLYPCLGTGKTIADGYPEEGLCCFGLFPSLAVRLTVLSSLFKLTGR